MSRRILPQVTAMLLATANPAMAQTAQRPAPNDMLKVADSSTSAMLATLERSVEAQLGAQLNSAERPETAERIAGFKKNLFDALRKRGFTAEQSMQIVVATPLPAVGR
ncbi:hypothetical protein [Massilia sp. PWRC2]|uniref:hypothetical protein n=1 Tax=Massilia sp. PWRC2 TaxID=2804626 RepID=UPI003CF1D6CD